VDLDLLSLYFLLHSYLFHLPFFIEIVPMTESYEKKFKSLELPFMGPIYAAFTTYHSNKFVYARGGGFASRWGRSRRGGRHQQNRPICCQICRGKGITSLLVETVTPILQMLPTLYRFLPHAALILIKPLIGIWTLEPLHT
jgi:hypothetical protein